MNHPADAGSEGEQSPDARALFPDLDAAVMEAMLSDWGKVQPNQLAIAHPKLVREIRSCDPLKAAATFGGLLTLPEIQANCVRLEALVHLSLAYGKGRRKPNRDMVERWFATIGAGKCGQLEDPAEDVHISLVTTSRGDFRIFEGIWEGAGFNLQRVLGVMESMPAGPPFDDLRSSVFALLALSDATAARAKLDRYVLGEEFPQGYLPPGLLNRLSNLRRTIRFSRSELETMGVPRHALAIFMLDHAAQHALADQPLGHTSLERCPLLADGDGVCLVLPTAVSAAVRRAVIEWCLVHGIANSFERGLCNEYSAFLGELPLLGGKAGVPAQFQSIGDVFISAAFQKIDTGRYINWVFFVDGLVGYEQGGLRGANPSPKEVGNRIATVVADSQAAAATQPDFRAGLTMIVGCGWGRGLRLQALPERAQWRWQILDAKDLETLSYAPRFQPLSLWRALDGVDIVERTGVSLSWANGLLNLVAWQRSLDEHLVPHASLPVDFVEEGRTAFLMVPQNSLRDLRHEVYKHNDVRSIPDGHGHWVAVRKIDSGYFKEDALWPLYASTTEIRSGRLRAVFASTDRAWWVELKLPADARHGMYFEYWQMLGTWLCRAVPVIESALHSLPKRPITWSVSFAAVPDQRGEKPEPLLTEALAGLLQIETDTERATVSLSVEADFVSAFHNSENIAEQALVDALLRGIFKLVGQQVSGSEHLQLLARIVPDHGARHIHLMQARSFRDFTRPSLPRAPLLISRQDSALSRIGLGWRAAARGPARTIEGQRECQDFLNATVKSLEDELCSNLRFFDRRSLLEAALRTHESAAVDRDRWRTTAKANLALRNDKSDVLRTIAGQQSRLNGVSVAARILIEAGLCECSDGGAVAGELDLSRLMTTASSLFHLGGWSNAIRWGAMEPKLKISALGDVMATTDFEDGVLSQFGQVISDMEIDRSTEKYPQQYDAIIPARAIEHTLESAFTSAWHKEFGATVDEVRSFIDTLENEGLRRSAAIYWLRLAELPDVAKKEGDLVPSRVEHIAARFILAQRREWRTLPDGFAQRDRWPWRFRRRLSLMRYPLPLCDRSSTGEAELLVAPGMVRENFAYLVSNLLHGGFSDDYASSAAMRSWIGAANDRSGHTFNEEVAARMRELGWETRTEVRLTEIMRRGLDRDYGDVDVLAWRASDCRVLVIECKDMQFSKTPGEVAEQLADFRGEFDKRGKPDLLRKHLNRVDRIRENIELVSNFVKIPETIRIEAHLVFRNPVPMSFVWERLANLSKLWLFNELDKL